MGNSDIQVHFSVQGLMVLNAILGLVMFGIALELRKEEFTALLKNARSAIAGLAAHFVLLPLLTFALVKLLHPPPAVGLGMILVGACPGGNMSNMFTYMAKGNTALAVGLTSVSHLLAVFLTPFNFSLYGSLDEGTAGLLKEIHLSFFEVGQTIVVVVLIPLILGMALAYFKPVLTAKLNKWMKRFSLLAFGFFLIAAFASNLQAFTHSLDTILPLVMLHNALALLTGYSFASLLRLPVQDRRTIAFETGVQNSGLGLILIFNFFNGMGGMAIVAACWGVWHLVTGGGLAWWWGRNAEVKTT